MIGRVLLVEDDLPSAAALGKLLAREGLVVEPARTVAEAFIRLLGRFDLILLDLMLPDGNGVQVLRYLREAGIGCAVAVISAANDPELFRQVAALAPDAVFGKPLDVGDFLDWVRKLPFGNDAVPAAA